VETLVLVLTDVQGSTRLWQDEPVAMDAAMTRHHEIVHRAVQAHGGFRPVDQGEGDAVFAAFRSASEAVFAVVQVQRELAAEQWTTSVPLRVRIGVHVGEVTERGGNLYGDPVNRCARLRGLGAGGQSLLSAPVYELVRDRLPVGTAVTDLGEHRMKDLVRPEHVWQLDLDGLLREFPPLASLDRAMHNLPVQPSALIGRKTELAAVLAALESHRLVTLTGFGGMGKTRLSLQAAAELADGDGDGVWFVDLAGATDPATVPGLIGKATGLGGSDADSVITGMSGQRLLLVLDNLEQVLGCASFISDLLARVPGVKVLATSREPLRLRGEQELAIAPLALPPQDGPQDAATLSAYAAVELFVQRAVAVSATFAVTNDNAPAVAGICQRLDGHPLAIELAAARVRMMTPQALLPRLDQALSVLTGGGRDLPGRQQTLRATIAWSYDLLEAQERLLLDRVSVFAGPVGFELIEAVCGEDLDVFDALASLVDKSLVRRSVTEAGEDRYGTLVSIGAFAAEQLAASGQDMALRALHARHVVAEAALRAPYTMVEVLRRNQRTTGLYDELALAWAYAQQHDAAMVPSFPLRWFELVFDRTTDTSGLDVLIAHSHEPTMDLIWALRERLAFEAQAGRPTMDKLTSRLQEVADGVGRPEGQLLALAQMGQMAGRSAVELRTYVGELDALLVQIPADSPWSREDLQGIRDNMTYIALQYLEPQVAEQAAARNLAAFPDDSIRLSNLSSAYYSQGKWQQVLDVTADVVRRGPVRTEFAFTHAAVSLAARALVQLQQTEQALDLLAPWAVEVTRRGWTFSLEVDATARAEALLALHRTQEAADLIAGLTRPLLRPLTKLMALRIDRITGQSLDPAEPAALADSLKDMHFLQLPPALAAMVEQALREPSPDAQRLLLDQIDELDGPFILPFGYHADQDQLRTEHSTSDDVRIDH
jgi:predicted ATPase/class 3 adenylate cyclase